MLNCVAVLCIKQLIIRAQDPCVCLFKTTNNMAD